MENQEHHKEIKKELKLVFQELREDPYQKFNEAFALMSIIPLLVFFYILVTELFGIDILVGKIGLLLTITVLITLAGYYVAYIIIRSMLNRILFYAAAAKHSDEMKSRFVASVSHELKNPISIIKSNVFNLVEGLLGKINEEQKKVLGICYNILQRMTRLTAGLLDLYKIEAGMVGLEPQECDLAGILNRQLEEFGAQLNEKKQKLIKKIPLEGLTAWLDEGKTERIIHNIVGNAIKYTPEGGTVTVHLFSSEGFAVFECIDTGEGIPDDKLQKVFDKFERLGRRDEGTGLGLAITKDLVELQKGKIMAESTVGKGSTFTIILPLDVRTEERGEHGRRS